MSDTERRFTFDDVIRRLKSISEFSESEGNTKDAWHIDVAIEMLQDLMFSMEAIELGPASLEAAKGISRDVVKKLKVEGIFLPARRRDYFTDYSRGSDRG